MFDFIHNNFINLIYQIKEYNQTNCLSEYLIFYLQHNQVFRITIRWKQALICVLLLVCVMLMHLFKSRYFLIVDTESLAATFREPWSYLQIELTSRNNWNNYIDASDIRLEFLTTKAEGVIVFASGPISGDFLQIRLIGRTRARATINLGKIFQRFLLSEPVKLMANHHIC